MELFNEIINLDKKWLSNEITKYEYKHLINYYTLIAVNYYKHIHPELNVCGIELSVGMYSFHSIYIAYRPDMQRYCMFSRYIDSVERHHCGNRIPDTYNEVYPRALMEIQIIIDRRASFSSKELIDYLINKIGCLYTLKYCTLDPSYPEQYNNDNNQVSAFTSLLKWMSDIEKIDVTNFIENEILDHSQLNYIENIVYSQELGDDDFNDKTYEEIIDQWLPNNYPEHIHDHPIIIAINNGDFELASKLLDSGLPYMSATDIYMHGSTIYFHIISIKNKYQDKMWNLLMEKDVPYDYYNNDNENILDYIMKWKSIDNLIIESKVTNWFINFLEKDAKNPNPCVFKIDIEGENLYKKIKNRMLKDKIDEIFKNHPALNVTRPYWR
jgi:hypothetical protein